NGAFWRGDHQGLADISYGITIPEIPAHIEGTIPLAVPVTMTSTNTVIHAVTIPVFDAGFLGIPIDAGPVTIPAIVITGPTLTGIIGSPTSAININTGQHVGPIRLSFLDIPAAPGFGNSTTNPSSGFFNLGQGTVSGFGNLGARTSGFLNVGSGISGVQNVGALQSGLANLGD
ncbi:hypothetical protein, partial [Mycobacterium marinum]